MAGGAFAAIAILAALQERHCTGKGATLDLSLFESAFFWAAMRHSLEAKVDPRAHIFPVNDVFQTADGKRLTLGILEEHFWENFLKAAPALRDERFATDALRRKNGDELSAKIEATMKSKTAAEWLSLLGEHDVPVDLCVSPAETKEIPHVKERQTASGEFVPFPVWANGRRGGRIRSGVPALGEHSREILVELGFDDGEIAEMRKTGCVPV
jgi:crotonobetainyl-CoA:carnitine CoA-transferase CaiB-like acyl-CoA transferase